MRTLFLSHLIPWEHTQQIQLPNFCKLFLLEIQCSHYSCPGSLDFNRQPGHAVSRRKLEKVGVFEVFPNTLTNRLRSNFVKFLAFDKLCKEVQVVYYC